MKISLFIPCFIDQFYPQVGMCVVRILERLGHEVDYPEKQTCCGQPPFNGGHWDESRHAAEHALDCFRDSEIVVTPSGSCGAMMKVFYPELFANTEREAEAKSLAARTFEFSQFLVNELKVTDIGATFNAKITFHDGCHGLRELGVKNEPRTLLSHVKGIEFVEMKESDTCCGFGGLFSVKYPEISSAMGRNKCESVIETQADAVVSNDASCLMHIQGLLQRNKKNVRCLHLAEILAGEAP